jgi:glutamate racemase
MIKAEIDYLVLGCTHYHFLMPILKKLLPNNVNIIDSAEAVARQTKSVLKLNKLSNSGVEKGKSQFYTNGTQSVIANLLKFETVTLKKLDF